MRNIFDRKIKCGVNTQQETLEHAHNHLSTAAVKAGLGPIGWHTLRHTYRAWLGDNGEPLTVQKELMRRASIQTTLNTYGGGMFTRCERRMGEW